MNQVPTRTLILWTLGLLQLAVANPIQIPVAFPHLTRPFPTMADAKGRHYYHKIQSEYHYKQHLLHYEQYLQHQRLSIARNEPEFSDQFEEIEEHEHLRHQRHREAMVNIGRTRPTSKVETAFRPEPAKVVNDKDLDQVHHASLLQAVRKSKAAPISTMSSSASTPTPTASILTPPSTTYITTSATTAPDPGPNCHDFICLLGNFDLLKTDSGYLLTTDGRKNEDSSAAAKCQDFLCWLSQFEIKSKSFGFQLVRKDPESVTLPPASKSDLSEMTDIFRLGMPTSSLRATPSNSVPDIGSPSSSIQSTQSPLSLGNWDKTTEDSLDEPEDFWSSFKFNQSEDEDEEAPTVSTTKPQPIPHDTYEDFLNNLKDESVKEPPQKSLTKLDYDSLFGDYNF